MEADIHLLQTLTYVVNVNTNAPTMTGQDLGKRNDDGWMLLSADLKLPQSNLPAVGVTEQQWPLALRCPIVADAGRFHCKKPGSKTRQGKGGTKESHVMDASVIQPSLPKYSILNKQIYYICCPPASRLDMQDFFSPRVLHRRHRYAHLDMM